MQNMRIGGIVVVALRALHRCLSRQFIEQRLRVLKVGGVEALGEPVVDVGQYRARFVVASSIAKQPSETPGRGEGAEDGRR